MALILCPNCGESVSDKAVKCVHCDAVLKQECEDTVQELKCKECDTVLSETDLVCSNCGCPVYRKDSTGKKSETALNAGNFKNIPIKKLTIGICAILLVCVIAIIASIGNSKKKEKETYNLYIENTLKAQELMLSGAQKSEALCQLTGNVWKNAIYEISDSETNEYTSIGGRGNVFYDFNESLGNLFGNSETQNKIASIEDNQDSVSNIMKKLQDTPKGLEKCYDAVMELNQFYNELTHIAISPTGSYTSYVEQVNNVTSEFASQYKQLTTIVPEKK